MSDDAKAATVFVGLPVRVPVNELDAYRAAHPAGQPSPRSVLPLPVLECSATSPADGPCPVCPHLAERFEPFRRAAYWQTMHAKAKGRIAELEQHNAELEAKLRLREQQLFGKKSEAGDRKSTRLNSSHHALSRMPSSA